MVSVSILVGICERANLVIPYSCGKSYHSFAPSSDVIVILRCSVDVTSEDSDSN